LLESTELYHRAQHEFAAHGVKVEGLSFDVAAMQKRKGGIVRQMTQGILGLFKAAGVTALTGHGKLLPGRKVEFTASDGSKRALQARHVVLASGSEPMALRGVDFDGKHIVDSWGALEFEAVPKRLCVIGAGVIGLELGSVWRRLGAETVVLEALEQFLPMADGALSKEALVTSRSKASISVSAQSIGEGREGWRARQLHGRGRHQSLVVDRVIVAIGRVRSRRTRWPMAQASCSIRAGSSRSTITARRAESVWAVGDCVRGPMLAHKGKEEGVAVADLIAGQYGHVNYNVIPSVIYTAPEIAWVGQTEEQAKAGGRTVKTGSFPFAASGRAKAMEAGVGFCKVVSDAANDEILGIHIIGPMAGELIAEAVLAMEYSASSEDLQRTVHAHPTLGSRARSRPRRRQAGDRYPNR
jgi:dihydrolipoamide dehydrogenase